jgi:predicted permease
MVFDVAPDLAIFAYVCAVSPIAGMISGLAPAMESSRVALKPASSGGTATAGTRRLQDILIAAQVTLSLVLMVAAAMAIRSSTRAVAIDTGYETRQVLALNIQFPDSLKYTASRKRALMDELRVRLARLPGVVTMTSARTPADMASRTAAATLERTDSSRLGRQAILHYTFVQPNYFETLGIPLILGGGFTARAERTVVVSESAAHELWGSQDPIGRIVRLGATDEVPRRTNELVADGLSYQVAGVARDTRTTDFSATVTKRIYLQLSDDRAATYPILMRIRNTPAETIRLIEPLLTAVDPNLVADCATLEYLLRQTAAFITAMLAALVSSAVGLMGLALAIMGIYGTVSYIVVLRTREVGIRMAIGAQAGDVLWAILRECARPLLAGLALGSIMAAGLAYFARGLLFGLDGIDVESQAVVALTLLAIGLIASYPPARRATRVDPLVALRHQ